MPLTLQLVWLFALALPIACIAWTVTHEEVFREPREYCIRQSEAHPNRFCRKFYFLFTCEFCFSHYVTAFFLVLTHYKLLFNDWRGYLIALLLQPAGDGSFGSVYAHLRLDIRKDRVEIKHVEKKVEELEERKAA